MSRLDARWKHFWANGKFYKHFWQNFTSGDVTAPGSTLVVTCSLPTSGSASASSSVAGQVLARSVSLIAGTATGGANATGTNILETWSLFPGTATGTANAVGSTMAVNNVVIEGLHTTDGNAPLNLRLNAAYRHFWNRRQTHRHFWAHFEGADVSVIAPALVIVFGILVEGSAHGDANVSGTTLARSVSLIPGTASGDANEPHHGIDVYASIVNGELTTDAYLDGQLITVGSSILVGTYVSGQTINVDTTIVDGSASGQANADGDTVSVLALIADEGSAYGDANIDGDTVNVDVSLLPGAAFDSNSALVPGDLLIVLDGLVVIGEAIGEMNAEASGDLLVVDVSLLSGDASGEVNVTVPGDTIIVDCILIWGFAQGSQSAEASGDLLVVDVVLLPGIGFAVNPGDGIASGDVVTVSVSIVSGQAFGDKQPGPNTMGGVSVTPRRIPRVDVIVPGALIVAEANLVSGRAHGAWQFTIETKLREIPSPPLAGHVVGNISRRAHVGGSVMHVGNELIGGHAAGHATVEGQALDGLLQYTGDEDEFMLEEI